MSASSTTDRSAVPPPGAVVAHALAVEAVLAALDSDRDHGLRPNQVATVRARVGPNRLVEAPGVSTWSRFRRQFQDLVIWILIVAAGIALALGETVNAIAILAVVLVNGILGFMQEERAARALEGLKKLSSPFARVVRDGVLRSIPAADLVPGDRIEVEAGDHVPADARLITAVSLRAQEAALTGESTPVHKDAASVLDPGTPLGDRRNLIHMGTVIAGGRASAVVTTTGMATELGHVASLLERTEYRATPLQRRLAGLGKVLVLVCLAIVAVVTVLQLLRGGELLEVFLLSVSLAVAAVPEGLPAVVTVVLALGLQRMVRRNVLVRRLPSVETLGSVTVICSDKTGTLTCNEMTVRELSAGDVSYRVTGAGYVPRGQFVRVSPRARPGAEGIAPAPDGETVHPRAEQDLLRALTVGARCNNARIQPAGDGSDNWTLIGDPTEGALLVAALKAEVESLDAGSRIVFEIPFDAERRAMSVAVRDASGRVTLFTKGAPEVVLAACVAEQRGGRVVALDERRRQAIVAENARMAGEALRVLGLAFREDPGPGPAYEEDGLVFAGLVGMLDPPREEARAAVQTCHGAGIRPVMITGDHPQTALAIARELGIAGPADRAISGRELDAISDGDLAARVESFPVYARVSAEHKLRVVRAWKGRGHVVAMTGDGVNDAPAVRSADIGVAMGVTGTDVTREAADMVLLDDNFASIVAAVEEGRGIFDNIQKFVHYLLSTNAGEVMLMLFAALAGWPIPLLAIHILWINLVTDGLPALALGVEPPERDIMRRRPRPPGLPVISRRESAFIVLRGMLVAAAAATAFTLLHGGQDANLPHARAVAFCVTAYAQLFYAFAFRSQRHTLPELGLFSNRQLLAAIVLAAALQFAVVTAPFLQPLFGVSRPIGREWAVIGALSLVPVTLLEVAKIVRSALRRRRVPSGAAWGRSINP